jgi:hypothetical protein
VEQAFAAAGRKRRVNPGAQRLGQRRRVGIGAKGEGVVGVQGQRDGGIGLGAGFGVAGEQGGS